MRKIKVGITHGDINGVGYEIILKTFENPEMLELCTPIVYGSPKTATYHRKSFECATNFIVKNNAREADENSLNIVNCFGEEEIKIDFGKSTVINLYFCLTKIDVCLIALYILFTVSFK